VTGGKLVACSQSVSGVSVNSLVTLYDIHKRERCHSILLSLTPRGNFERALDKSILTVRITEITVSCGFRDKTKEYPFTVDDVKGD
jgi:hypothetical protein